jgi:hypothetical protein
MDFLTILTTVVGAINALALAVFGHVYRTIAQERKERNALAAEVSQFRAEVPRDYVPKVDFRDGMNELKNKVSAIYDILIRQGNSRE